jgi:acetylornithine/succinyldiaminopimelate/putrescine aminotransferase
LEQVQENAPYVMERLRRLQSELPEYILEIRGSGYMIGIQIAESPMDMVALLREKGLIVPPAETDVIRFLPALTATKKDFDEAIALFGEASRERSALIRKSATA